MSEQPTAVQIKILDKEYQINCPPSEQEALIAKLSDSSS